MNKIFAERDGRTHEFPAPIWNAMPQHKYGWKEKARPIPQVVKDSMAMAVTEKPALPKKSGAKKKSETTDIV